MTANDWHLFIINAVDAERYRGDKEPISLVADMLEMYDKAKQKLREKGYGVTGRDLLETVEEVPHSR